MASARAVASMLVIATHKQQAVLHTTGLQGSSGPLTMRRSVWKMIKPSASKTWANPLLRTATSSSATRPCGATASGGTSTPTLPVCDWRCPRFEHPVHAPPRSPSSSVMSQVPCLHTRTYLAINKTINKVKSYVRIRAASSNVRHGCCENS